MAVKQLFQTTVPGCNESSRMSRSGPRSISGAKVGVAESAGWRFSVLVVHDGGVTVHEAQLFGPRPVMRPKSVEQARLAERGQARFVMQVQRGSLHPPVAALVALVDLNGGATPLQEPGEGQAAGAPAHDGNFFTLK